MPKLLVAIFRPPGIPLQRNSVTGDFVDSQNGKMLAPLGRNSLLVFITAYFCRLRLSRLTSSSGHASAGDIRPCGSLPYPIEINTTSHSSRRLRSFAGPRENPQMGTSNLLLRRLTADDHVYPATNGGFGATLAASRRLEHRQLSADSGPLGGAPISVWFAR